MYQHGQIADIVRAVANKDDTYDVLDQFCFDHGFDRFAFAVVFRPLQRDLSGAAWTFLSGYPVEWRGRYFENNYYYVDPVIGHCLDSDAAVNWSTLLMRGDGASSAGRIVMDEARDFGLRSGCSFPVHESHGRIGILSLASRDEHSVAMHMRMRRVLPLAQTMLCHLFETAIRALPAPKTGPAPKSGTDGSLSEREKECLRWAAEGKTAWETGQILNVSERTAVFHLNNAMKKLGAVNRTHAVARALHRSLISL